VEVELVCTDRRVDLVEERFDVAIRAGHAPDSTLTSRRLGAVSRILVATPAVVARIGRVALPTSLRDCATVAFAAEGTTWRLTSGGKVAEVRLRPRLVVNDYDMLLSLTQAGCGVALLPEYLCREDLERGRLRRLLPAWAAPEIPVFALYPSRRHLSPKVLALLELLSDRLELGGAPRRRSSRVVP
jgi:DNA-binding transcriptional LysR family regulator